MVPKRDITLLQDVRSGWYWLQHDGSRPKQTQQKVAVKQVQEIREAQPIKNSQNP